MATANPHWSMNSRDVAGLRHERHAVGSLGACRVLLRSSHADMMVKGIMKDKKLNVHIFGA